MARLLIVHHCPTELLGELAGAVVAGAEDDGIEGVEVQVADALAATADDVLAADGYLLGTPANFGYISGALKHFFDSTYEQVREETAKRPFSYWIHGRYDTVGAETAMSAITTGLQWRLVAAPLVFTGAVDAERLSAARELGATVAATLT